MCFNNLHNPANRSCKQTIAKRYLLLGSTCFLLLSGNSVYAQTPIEDVEVPAPVILQSGVPIPDLEDAARRAIVTDKARQSGQSHPVGVRQYQLGHSTVREYRSGKQLMSVEVINASGSRYIVEHSHQHKLGKGNPRKGVVVSTW